MSEVTEGEFDLGSLNDEERRFMKRVSDRFKNRKD